MPTCPKCRAVVDTKPAFARWSNRPGWYPTNRGIRCRSCNTILAVNSAWAVAIKLLAPIVGFALLLTPAFHFLLDDWGDSAGPAIFLFLWLALFMGLGHRYAPRLLRLRLPEPGQILESDDELFPDNTDTNDMTLEEYEELFGPIALSVDPVGKDWNCISCGSPNESEFRLCWQCGKAHEVDGS